MPRRNRTVAGMTNRSLVTHLERDAKLIRVLLLLRSSLDRIQGAEVRLPGTTQRLILDNVQERRAIDASLRLLGIDPDEPGGPPAP